jgi:hypothetical protein
MSRKSKRCVAPAVPVSRILKRLGLNRIGALEPADPVRRYASSRWALPCPKQCGSDRRRAASSPFLKAARAYYKSLGVKL